MGPETQWGIISYLITRELRLVTWPTEFTCRDYSSTSFSHLSTNVGGATDVSQVLDLIMYESWGNGDVLYFLRDYRVYRGYGYENESLPPSCWEQEQRPGHHTVAHAGLGLWGWKGFGEEMVFQSQEFSRYTQCIRSPSPGHVQRHREGKQRASSRSPNQHGWNVGVRVRSGKEERLKEQQGLDSFSL